MLTSYENAKKNPHPVPNDYSINLMWINSTLDEIHPFISNHLSEEDFLKGCLNKAKAWKESNPDAEVNLWYDSHFVTPAALETTKLLLQKKFQEDKSYKINLRDIREIDMVANNPDVFTDFIPIYFRVDLMKFIICVDGIESEGKEAVIFSDLEVGDSRKIYGKSTERMTKEELFTDVIMEKLMRIGIQACEDKGIGSKLENQFFQVINKPDTINAIKVFINANLSRVITALNLEKQYRNYALPDLGKVIFATMKNQLFSIIEMISSGQEIVVNAKLFDPHAEEKMIPYDLKKHGALPLGNLYFARNQGIVHILEGNVIEGDKIKSAHSIMP